MIIKGDCLDHLKDIKNNSIDLILIDPPYLISRDSNFKNKTNNKFLNQKYDISIDFGTWDKKELDWKILFHEYKRILKKGGTLIIFYDIWKIGDIKEQADNFKFKQPRICAWIKNNPVPVNSKSNYLSNTTEYFLTFVKGGKPTFNSEYDKGFYNYPICHGKERLDHPTQKPLKLIMDLIEKHSNPGDLVLDTFAGSGTTGEACKLLDRKFILIEKDNKYFDLIKQRLGF
jgi:site-specific DNA-methyltransferase (adenine-specific)